MSSQKYENQILDAIQTIVDNTVEKAAYDKTIRAIVSKCEDENLGKYLIKYQDSVFYAYGNPGENIYTSGTEVYILVPGNDMSQVKTIIGSVNNLGSDYIPTIDLNSEYNILGINIINSANEEIGLCSYTLGGESKVLYDKTKSENILNIDAIAATNYIQKSEYLLCGADFKTSLPAEQKFKGNYGIAFDIDFLNPSNNEIITKTYLININDMTGDPYNFNQYVSQRIYFSIDGENFRSINKITVFEKDFPKESQEITENDIFISNIFLSADERMTEEELSGYSLNFVTPQGTIFGTFDLDSSIREIQTVIKIAGKKVPEDSPILKYYWFKENSSVDMNHSSYNRYGGIGWECLNNYKTLSNEEGELIKEWIPAEYNYITKKEDNTAKENIYKCVAIYNNATLIEKNIVITNYDTEYEFSILSTNGNYFYQSVGITDLILYINGENPQDLNDWTFKWNIVDNNNQYISLEEDQRIIKNTFYNLEASEIVNFSTYKCFAYKNDVYKGNASITIINSKEKDINTYSLVINNGNQVFKYNEEGISPTSLSMISPQIIYPLSFTLYDEMGRAINSEVVDLENIIWTFSNENSMINISKDIYTNYEENLENKTINFIGYRTINFTIPTLYSMIKNNNKIKLTIRYDNKIIIAESELIFLKEGENGSNGTEFVCRIVPNTETENIEEYPTYTWNTGSESGSLNFTPLTNAWFKVQLWRNGLCIFDNTESGISKEGKEITVAWGILKNNNSDLLKVEYSNYNIQQETGIITFNSLDVEEGDSETEQERKENPANVIQCNIFYEGKNYYATMPIITVKTGNTYKTWLQKNTGFLEAIYTADGIKPSYNNSVPFTLEVYNGNDEDISLDSTISYNWEVKGLSYTDTWDSEKNLIERAIRYNDEQITKNQKNYTPIDKFNGYCINNALLSSVFQNGTKIMTIHIPIQLYLNRYGNSALNDWDGNHIEINNNGDFILAPQVGAGKKDNDNTFTGVLMGQVQENGKRNAEYGLYGYHKGERTIALSSEDGSARFGKSGAGQIILDPTNNNAIIKSGNYSIANKTGMQIDLTTPEIKFGSENFIVDSLGHLTAKGGGSIGSWQIANDKLYWEGTYIDSIEKIAKPYYIHLCPDGEGGYPLDNYGEPDYTQEPVEEEKKVLWVGTSNKPDKAFFAVERTGYLNARGLVLDEGQIRDSTIRRGTLALGLHSSGQGYSFVVNNSGYLTIDGQGSSGAEIHNAKIYTANESSIGGWLTAASALYSGSGTTYVNLNSSSTNTYAIWAGDPMSSSAPFRLTRTGALTLTSSNTSISNASLSSVSISSSSYGGVADITTGTFGNASSKFTLGTGTDGCSALYKSKSTFASTTSGVYLGTDGISLGNSTNYFKVTSGGTTTITNASISNSSYSGDVTSSNANISGGTISYGNTTLDSLGLTSTNAVLTTPSISSLKSGNLTYTFSSSENRIDEIPKIYSGTGTPSNSTGKNGDIYIKYS